ncbi:MAG: chorismate mutase [Acidimicrobiales bacterium]
MTQRLLRAVRGATTCEANTAEAIGAVTVELLGQLMERNRLDHDDVVSVIFTTSPDLTAAFPATAARTIGFGDVPLLCASEIDVPGSMRRCVRILLHVYAEAAAPIHHVYLHDARALRDDLPE